jgi:nitroreductase
MDDVTKFTPNVARYEALMDVVCNRLTTRAFRPDIAVPREHFEMVLEAARHGPSGANAQP